MQDMTISEVLTDPLIGELLRADNVSHASFAQVLEDAANGGANRPATDSRCSQRQSLARQSDEQQSAA